MSTQILRLAPNHAQHRDVVELVELSDDDQFRDWLLGGALTAQREADARPLEKWEAVRNARGGKVIHHIT